MTDRTAFLWIRTGLVVLLTLPFVTIEAENTGMVVGTGVRVRSGPGTSNPIVTNLNTGDLVGIVGKSEKPERIDPGREFHYHWYQIVLSGGLGGWIYGQFLYPRMDDYRAPGAGTRLTLRGQRYTFAVFREEAISLEMPVQDSYKVPCFIGPDGKRAQPLRISNSSLGMAHRQVTPADGPIFRFVENTSFGEEVGGSPLLSSTEILLPVGVHYQEGGARYNFIIQFDGEFTLVDIRAAK